MPGPDTLLIVSATEPRRPIVLPETDGAARREEGGETRGEDEESRWDDKRES